MEESINPSVPAASELPAEVLADLQGLIDEMSGSERVEVVAEVPQPLPPEEDTATGLPASIAADLQGLIEEMKQDRMPGFDHDPPEVVPADSETFASLTAVPTEPGAVPPPVTAAVTSQSQALAPGVLAPSWVAPAVDGDETQSPGIGAWMQDNWPFVLAGAFMLLGVFLVIQILTTGSAAT